MAKVGALQKKVNVGAISKPKHLQRLARLFQEKYRCKSIDDKGDHVAGHWRVIPEEDQEIDIVVYTTDLVMIRASPRVADDIFNRQSVVIEGLAKQATTPVSKIRPLTIQRARTIFEYASKLDLAVDGHRMVAVVLCDTSNEILLREQMIALGIQGSPLDSGIPDKIRTIESKGQAVYRSAEIKNIRDLRNGIVHRGEIPDQTQAGKCVEITCDVLTHC
jgi:hypothetical protein